VQVPASLAPGRAEDASAAPLIHRSIDVVSIPARNAPPERRSEDGRAHPRPSSGAVHGEDAASTPVPALVRSVLGRPVREAISDASGARASTGTTPAAALRPPFLPPVVRRALPGHEPATPRPVRPPPLPQPKAEASFPADDAAWLSAARPEGAPGGNAADPPANATTAHDAAASYLPALPWGTRRDTTPIAGSTQDVATIPALRWPARGPAAAPAVMTGVLAITDSLRAHVTKEVQQAKDAVDRAVASRRPEPRPAAGLIPDDDTVRKMLVRMRTLIQEERFRSGMLR